MIDREYCGEIEDLLTQFVAAFDDARIIRSRKNSNAQEVIVPRWVVAGKPRVFHDIINQAKNITLPVVVVEPQGISLQTKNLENKNLPQKRLISGQEFRFKQPTPIELKISVTFYSKYLSDIWQMGTNFIAFSNPCTFITVTNPVFDSIISEKINCKVTWDGSYSIKYSNPVNHDENWLISATANFTIEGYIFQKPVKGSKIITSINLPVVPCTYNMMEVTDEDEIVYNRILGWPVIKSVVKQNKHYIKSDKLKTILLYDESTIITGASFFTTQNTGVIIVPVDGELSDIPEYLTEFSITTIKHGKIVGYKIKDEYLNVSENEIKIHKLPKNEQITKQVKLYVYNNAGFTEVNSELNLTIAI